MEFLCDEMLKGLGRWLRIAGYDTRIINVRMDDLDILEIALKENRLLLTRDRSFAMMKRAEKKVLLLESNGLEACIRELNSLLDIDWFYKPFSRCIVCNTCLEIPDEAKVKDRVPVDVTHVWFCPHCDKVFWQASHTSRMFEKLALWQSLR